MADTYEKDLGQKSSLTTSDFIRVVGSDNVSYKQLVSDVLTVGATIDATGSDKDLDTIYTNQRSGSVVLINGQSEANQATAAGIIHFVISFKRSSVYGSQWEFRGNEAYVRNISGSSWGSWVKMPTRAEIDALKLQRVQISVTGNSTLWTNKYYQDVNVSSYIPSGKKLLAVTLGSATNGGVLSAWINSETTVRLMNNTDFTGITQVVYLLIG